jgi:glucose-1-phosphate cytidylyltransferase
MKVVLFCGGQGMRIRGYNDEVPKPMIKIGPRPVLWHIMKYYAHFGHKDFILCLGYKAEVIKRYFLNYQEWLSNDLRLKNGGEEVELFDSDLDDWTITLVDTGLEASIGERLWAVRRLLRDEDAFLCNYADCLTDCHLPTMVEHFWKQNTVGTFMGIPPNYSFHVIQQDRTGRVTDLVAASNSAMRINGGYFMFRSELFDYMQPGEELVEEPFQRLIAADELSTYIHEGFWGCMDTFKEKMMLESLHEQGSAPWELWKEKADEKEMPRHHVIKNGKVQGSGKTAVERQ